VPRETQSAKGYVFEVAPPGALPVQGVVLADFPSREPVFVAGHLAVRVKVGENSFSSLALGADHPVRAGGRALLQRLVAVECSRAAV
jgi:hypothetical protein